MSIQDPNERSAEAGEYVLGTLDAAARSQFERDAAADPALRRDQYFWEQRLARLGLQLPPVAPRPLVWLGLVHRLAPAPRAGAPAQRITTAWAALATAASLVLGFGLYRQMNLPPPAPERVEVPVVQTAYVSLLSVEKMHWTVSLVPGTNELVVRAGGEAPAAAKTRDAELWLITDAGPVSLGVIPKAGEVRRALPAGLPVAAGRTLAVSLEPVGGSPTGSPTGPVVATATLLNT